MGHNTQRGLIVRNTAQHFLGAFRMGALVWLALLLSASAATDIWSGSYGPSLSVAVDVWTLDNRVRMPVVDSAAAEGECGLKVGYGAVDWQSPLGALYTAYERRHADFAYGFATSDVEFSMEREPRTRREAYGCRVAGWLARGSGLFRGLSVVGGAGYGEDADTSWGSSSERVPECMRRRERALEYARELSVTVCGLPSSFGSVLLLHAEAEARTEERGTRENWQREWREATADSLDWSQPPDTLDTAIVAPRWSRAQSAYQSEGHTRHNVDGALVVASYALGCLYEPTEHVSIGLFPVFEKAAACARLEMGFSW